MNEYLSNIPPNPPERGNQPTIETLPIDPQAQEKIEEEKAISAIEAEIRRMDLQTEKFESIYGQMPEEEQQYVENAMLQSAEGKNAVAQLQEKLTALLHAGHHTSHELSETYNPKIIKLIGKLGKITGGLTGMLAGHGIASAGGAVIGAKIGEYGALKGFESIASRLPQSWLEKIKRPEDAIEIQHNQELIQEKMNELEMADQTLESLSSDIENLSLEEREKFNQLMQQDTQTLSTTEKLKDAYSRYGEFLDNFEKKYPILGTATEFALHAALGPLLEGMELGKGAIHAVEMLAASGATEPINIHFLHAVDTMKNAAIKVAQKMNNLFQKSPEIKPLAV